MDAGSISIIVCVSPELWSAIMRKSVQDVAVEAVRVEE